MYHASSMRKLSKAFQEKVAGIDLNKLYSPEEALALVKKCSYEEFDASVEVHVRTGIDPRKSDQTIRGSALLPHGTGKVKRVVVFAEGDKAEEAGKRVSWVDLRVPDIISLSLWERPTRSVG